VRRTFVLLTLILVGLAFCTPRDEAPLHQKQASDGDPRLVLILTVDQLRGDYLDHFEDVFVEGGFKRFLQQAVLFTEAHQDHANTSTGPGHATIATGAYPAHSGIVNNQWYEKNGTEAVYCVEDKDYSLLGAKDSSSGRSPRNLLVTALPDWIREANAESKVFSVSRKDRAAVLMGGKSATAAYWYDEGTGNFISSTYYVRELPEWLKRFNEKGIPRSSFGKSWSPLQVGEDARDSSEIVDTDHGRFDHDSSDAMDSPDSSFFTWFGKTPLMDEYMASMVKELIKNESLGADRQVDYLSLSFSVLDSVGHEYGPHSAELLDTIRRLDRVLADLFDYVDAKVGLENTIVVLGSDHGVMDLPEYALTQGVKAHRVDDEDVQCIQQMGSEFARLFGEEEDWFVNSYYFNQAAIERKGLSQSEMEKVAAELFSQCASVRRVWTRSELEQPPTEKSDPFWLLYWKSFNPERSPDLLFQMEKYYVGSKDTGTSHGSPYRYDTHVPIAFLLPGVRPARIEERVTTADIAPTLASLLGLTAPDTVDGSDLSHHF